MGNFSGTGYLPKNRKDSVNQTHVLPVYLKEGLLLQVTCPLKIQMIVTYILNWPYFIQWLLHHPHLCEQFLKKRQDCFVQAFLYSSFGDFSVHRKDWVTCFGAANRSGELSTIFFVSHKLMQVVNFLFGSVTVTL